MASYTHSSLFFKRCGDENGGYVFGSQLSGVPPVGQPGEAEGVTHGRAKVNRTL